MTGFSSQLSMFVCSRTKQGAEEAITVHFEAAIAVSGIIAPKLYIHLRKAQSYHQGDHEVSLTDMGFRNGRPTARPPEHTCSYDDSELEDDSFIGSSVHDSNVSDL